MTMLRYFPPILLPAAVLMSPAVFMVRADAPKAPTPAWNLTEGFKLPECACYDPTTKKVYVSNVATEATAKDGKGFLSVVTIDGKFEKLNWVTGLNAPKGIRVFENTLWVSCVDELVGIDVAKAEVVKRIKPAGAQFLNDVAVDRAGAVYVSDMLANRIYKCDGEKAAVFAEGEEMEWPSGLLVSGDSLVVGGWGKPAPDFTTKVPGRLFTLDLKTKKKTLITARPIGNIDGVEVDGIGGYILTDWVAGKVLHVDKDGNVRTMLEGFKGAADHAYLPEKNLLILPRMLENSVSAYELGKVK
jgi:sugar lactone lactonase YvrE